MLLEGKRIGFSRQKVSLRKKAQDVDIGEALVVPDLQFEEYQLNFE